MKAKKKTAKTGKKDTTLRIDYEFTLPKGFIDDKGEVHRSGVMRLATAADEIVPMSDKRVLANPEYHNILLLARVITQIGEITDITPAVIERLFVADLSYLLRMYREINDRDDDDGHGESCGSGCGHKH